MTIGLLIICILLVIALCLYERQYRSASAETEELYRYVGWLNGQLDLLNFNWEFPIKPPVHIEWKEIH